MRAAVSFDLYLLSLMVFSRLSHFAVLDGHGGADVAHFVSERLHDCVLSAGLLQAAAEAAAAGSAPTAASVSQEVGDGNGGDAATAEGDSSCAVNCCSAAAAAPSASSCARAVKVDAKAAVRAIKQVSASVPDPPLGGWLYTANAIHYPSFCDHYYGTVASGPLISLLQSLCTAEPCSFGRRRHHDVRFFPSPRRAPLLLLLPSLWRGNALRLFEPRLQQRNLPPRDHHERLQRAVLDLDPPRQLQDLLFRLGVPLFVVLQIFRHLRVFITR